MGASNSPKKSITPAKTIRPPTVLAGVPDKRVAALVDALTPTVGGIDEQAIALVMQLCELTEGVHTVAYKDPANKDGLPITNGVGATRNRAGQKWEVGDRITVDEAFWLLRRDVAGAYWPCATIPYWSEMTAHQRAALADLNYNEGYSYQDGDHDSLDLVLKIREYGRIGTILQLYDNNDHLGLSRRRFAEWLMFREKARPEDAYHTAWGINSVEEIMESIL